MRDIAPELARRGANVIVIGNGTPAQARAFQQEEDIPFSMYVDPDRSAYAALGMTRRVGVGTFVQAARAMRAGHRQTETQGDAQQNGGVVVLDAEGAVRFTYISRYSGDHVAPEAILAALPTS